MSVLGLYYGVILHLPIKSGVLSVIMVVFTDGRGYSTFWEAG